MKRGDRQQAHLQGDEATRCQHLQRPVTHHLAAQRMLSTHIICASCGDGVGLQRSMGACCGDGVGLQHSMGVSRGDGVGLQHSRGASCGNGVGLQHSMCASCGNGVGLQHSMGASCGDGVGLKHENTLHMAVCDNGMHHHT